MIKAKINDSIITIKCETKEEEVSIRKFCTYKDETNAFAGGSYNHMFVKDVCLLKSIKDHLVGFAGLTKEILHHCKEEGIKFEVEDNRTHLAFQSKEIDFKKLFPVHFKYTDHQVRALEMMQKTNRMIVSATTSAGKGDIMSAFIRMSGLRTLVLVDRATLANQLYERFKADGIDCGLVCSGWNIVKPVTISTIQSVKKVTGEFDCVMADEIHRHSAKSFLEFYKQSKFIYWYGFSGTVFNGSWLRYAQVRQFFGSIGIEIKPQELIENEVITPPKITFVPVEAKPCMSWQASYDINIVNGEERNYKIVKIASEYDKGVVVLVSRIEHGEKLASMIDGAKFVSGDSPLKERMSAIKELEENKIRVLVTSEIMREGISINNIQVLIYAVGGKGIARFIQALGRSLRLHKDKKEAIVYDFDDYGDVFLEKWSKTRKNLFIKNFGKEYVITT